MVPAGAYLAAQQARRLIIEEVSLAMRDLDALVAPTVGFVAPPHGVREAGGQPLRAALQACVVPPSEVGAPVASVPVGRHDGLPYAMQIIARPRAEGRGAGDRAPGRAALDREEDGLALALEADVEPVAVIGRLGDQGRAALGGTRASTGSAALASSSSAK